MIKLLDNYGNKKVSTKKVKMTWKVRINDVHQNREEDGHGDRKDDDE